MDHFILAERVGILLNAPYISSTDITDKSGKCPDPPLGLPVGSGSNVSLWPVEVCKSRLPTRSPLTPQVGLGWSLLASYLAFSYNCGDGGHGGLGASPVYPSKCGNLDFLLSLARVEFFSVVLGGSRAVVV